jgi:hypothetical protein
MKNLVVEPPFVSFEVWRRVRVLKHRCTHCHHGEYKLTYYYVHNIKSWPQIFALMKASDRLTISTFKEGRGWMRRRVVQVKIGRIR